MSSIYDKISTPKELIDSVKAHGLSLKQEDICRAQDIFGRAPIEDLVSLANDNGRRNEKGEPDPNGSWGGHGDGTGKYFYQILFHIWHWEDATRFYNQHSNPERKKIEELKAKVKSLEADNVKLEKQAAQLTERRDELLADQKAYTEHMVAHNEKLSEANHKAADLYAENVRLKAMLFDLMYAKEGN